MEHKAVLAKSFISEYLPEFFILIVSFLLSLPKIGVFLGVFCNEDVVKDMGKMDVELNGNICLPGRFGRQILCSECSLDLSDTGSARAGWREQPISMGIL